MVSADRVVLQWCCAGCLLLTPYKISPTLGKFVGVQYFWYFAPGGCLHATNDPDFMILFTSLSLDTSRSSIFVAGLAFWRLLGRTPATSTKLVRLALKTAHVKYHKVFANVVWEYQISHALLRSTYRRGDVTHHEVLIITQTSRRPLPSDRLQVQLHQLE